MAETGAETGKERARHWQYAELPGVDLLRARYIRKSFVRHTHENFVIAAIVDGVEVFHHGGADQYAGAGTLALVNPDTPHTGRAGVPEDGGTARSTRRPRWSRPSPPRPPHCAAPRGS